MNNTYTPDDTVWFGRSIWVVVSVAADGQTVNLVRRNGTARRYNVPTDRISRAVVRRGQPLAGM
jgi:hypothetical protein